MEQSASTKENNQITPAQVAKVAQLAMLQLTADEQAVLAQQLSEVMTYNVDKLNSIDTDGVEPTSQTTGLVNVWHPDQPQPGLTVSEALSQAPKTQDQQFVVNKVLD